MFIATLQAKAPTEVEPYRQLVLGVAQAVADAKGGEVPVETVVIQQIARLSAPAEEWPSRRVSMVLRRLPGDV